MENYGDALVRVFIFICFISAWGKFRRVVTFCSRFDTDVKLLSPQDESPDVKLLSLQTKSSQRMKQETIDHLWICETWVGYIDIR